MRRWRLRLTSFDAIPISTVGDAGRTSQRGSSVSSFMNNAKRPTPTNTQITDVVILEELQAASRDSAANDRTIALSLAVRLVSEQGSFFGAAAQMADAFEVLADLLRPSDPKLCAQAAKVAHHLREAGIAQATLRALLP